MGEEIFEKKKRKLTEGHLEALRRGRAKAAERRQAKKEMEKMEVAAVKKREEQRAFAKNLKKEQDVLEKIRIREREAKKRDEIKEREKKWEAARLAALDKCSSEAEYRQVSQILDTVTFDDIKSEDGVEKKLAAYLK